MTPWLENVKDLVVCFDSLIHHYLFLCMNYKTLDHNESQDSQKISATSLCHFSWITFLAQIVELQVPRE